MLPIDRRTALAHAAARTLTPLGLAAAQDKKPDPYADGKLLEGEPPVPENGSFTVAVLPDTQHYSEKYPDTYLAQTKRIAENLKARTTAWVLHLGDVTNHSTPTEWKNADRAMRVLGDAAIPCALCPGNHDYGEGGGCKDRSTRLSEYFPVSRFKGRPTFGGTYDKEPGRIENSFHLFSAGGREFLAPALESGPRADVVRWANEVAASRQVDAGGPDVRGQCDRRTAHGGIGCARATRTEGRRDVQIVSATINSSLERSSGRCSGIAVASW